MVSNFSLHHIIQLASKQKTTYLQPFPSLSLLHHQPTTTPNPKSDSRQANNTQPPSTHPQSEEFMQIIQKSNWKIESAHKHPALSPPNKSDDRRKFRAITSLPLSLSSVLPAVTAVPLPNEKEKKRESKTMRDMSVKQNAAKIRIKAKIKRGVSDERKRGDLEKKRPRAKPRSTNVTKRDPLHGMYARPRNHRGRGRYSYPSLTHSGSMPSSILSGTPDAPVMFAEWLSENLPMVFGLSRTEGAFVVVFLGDSALTLFWGVAWPAG